ncbi:pyridoxal phosphate-dependent decarboxylase family protein [Actinoallomurus soli]|uniref:pyridoxal phosphate-dependent decarboxylase family protein n=1 Tax=Actinoallomurus soli TaxID=2952535 RepID=UPI0020925FBA|nr:aminotransferase class V-fold PLP-dependent enzyme [Actinoallomurus soli]MCO5969927.1 aminotransferase class V-fold PLP-dependent enzyme [Actinoallomurus soli]
MTLSTDKTLPESIAASPSALADRQEILQDLSRYLTAAWESFDRPRPCEPEVDADLVGRLRAPLPERPDDARAALDDAVNILEASVSPSRPLFLAYVGSSGLEVSVLASALSAAYDANLATAAGAADLLDRQAVRWVADFVGFPLGEGHFTGGGQTSNLTALLAAREQALPGAREEGVAGRRATVYCSDEAHHSIARAVETAGLGRRALRRIPTDERRRMRVDLLRGALRRDRAEGCTPVAVVATAGTTLTGAVDPLAAIADVCEREGVWLHVDGAYGLPAAATSTAGHWFTGLDRADSVTIDAHKWLGMQKSCSVILMRRRGPLRAAFGHEERYMLHAEDTGNPVDRTFEYSRPFRSLRLWLSMRVHGAARFRSWIEGTLANAALLADEVRAHASFELLHEPMLSTVCFRHVPPGAGDDELDAHNERLARAMQADGRVYLAPAIVDGRTCLRACFVNFRTTPDVVKTVLEVADELGRTFPPGKKAPVRERQDASRRP